MKAIQENFKTARMAWVPQPERSQVGDIWVRALHEIYFKRMTTEAALKRANDGIDQLFTNIGLRKP